MVPDRNSKLLVTVSLIAAAALLATGCGKEEQGPAGSLQEVESIVLAVSDSLEGAAAGGPAFGSIIDARIMGDGSVLVLDAAANCIYEFDPEGSFIGEMVPSGPGPGELGYASSMTDLEDGNIAVNDPTKSCILIFSPDSGFINAIDGFPMTPVSEMNPYPGGGFVGWRSVMEQGEGGTETVIRVCRWVDGSEPESVFWENRVPADLSSFSAMLKQSLFSVSLTVDRQGRVFIAPLSTEEYSILCFSGPGEQYGTIEMPLERTPRTQEEIDLETMIMENRMRRMGDHGMGMTWEADPYRTMVGAMGIDSAGLLWVRRGTVEEPVFDVFDPDSCTRLCTATIDHPGSISDWDFRITPEGTLAWPTGSEDFQTVYFLEEIE